MKVMKTEPVVGRSEPDLRVYNILINCGYVEHARHATLIARHWEGFDTPEEAMIDLHKSLKKAFEEACKEYNHYIPVVEQGNPGAGLAEWISEYCASENDGSPGGYEPWEVLQGYGWDFPGRLVTGLVIEITENGEHVLSTEENVLNHCKAFKGEYVKYRDDCDWALTTDLDMFVLTVSKVEPKTPKKPGE
jgi:hypothetical protein